tara:strand:+ start:1351 stop:1563 length:213 start_codon:yes stop_codon:yes gene_type:complete
MKHGIKKYKIGFGRQKAVWTSFCLPSLFREFEPKPGDLLPDSETASFNPDEVDCPECQPLCKISSTITKG